VDQDFRDTHRRGKAMRVGDPEQLPFPGVGSRRRAAEPTPVGQAAAPLVW
jgi:hypothetical protein